MQELKDTRDNYNGTDLDINKVHEYLDRLYSILFTKLDILGKVAEKILDNYPAPKIRISEDRKLAVESTESKYNLPEDLLKGLTQDQQNQVKSILEAIRKHRVSHVVERQKLTDKQIISKAWHHINPEANTLNYELTSQIIESAFVIDTPLGFAILIKPGEEHQWGINSDKILGAYYDGNFIYVTTHSLDPIKINQTILHEYLHLIFRHFIKTHIPPQTIEMRNFISKLDSDDKTSIIRESDYYETRAAMRIFNEIQDELIAYAYGCDTFRGDLNSLVPVGEYFHTLISNDVENEYDKAKLINGMTDLQSQFSKFLKELRKPHTPKSIAYIIISSENFTQMARRIRLYIEEHKLN